MNAPDAIDLFAGPGGWSTGAASLGIREVGIEWDDAAVATARVAGHERVQEDIATMAPPVAAAAFLDRPVRGLIASPPCQGFSMAGKGKGRTDSTLLLSGLAEVRTRSDAELLISTLAPVMTDARTLLVLEPLRWALALTPSWLAWEQVPAVLPLWEACADVLRRIGYSVATGVVQAEQYGVPQTRRRAILVARAPWFTREHGPALLPTPTHSRYYPRDRDRLDPGVLPWVSMAQALGRGMTERPSMTVTGGGTGAGGAEPFGNAARQGMWRELAAGRWKGESDIRVTVQEASVLQSFPADYPWQGNKGQQYQQVGDAVPPLLARAILAEVAAVPR